MPNPLEAYFPVEDRADGTYIKVSRDVKANLNDIRRALNSGYVMNYDMKALEDVVGRARGGFEKIGPKFKYYNPDFDKYIEAQVVSPMKASILLNSLCLAEGHRPEPENLAFAMKRKGIVHGIDMKALNDLILSANFDTRVEAAKGREPKKGKDARIMLEVDANPDAKPQVRSDGSVDFRNIQTFTLLKEGQVIARKIPATEGEPGMSVTGESIPPEPGKDVSLPQGKNTRISEDGKYLIAEKAGILHREGTAISIVETLTIPRDVDFSTGNIKFPGDVIVNGNVKPGFTVESEGNITIKGEVESAQVLSRNGTVEIQRGVLGKGETTIFGKSAVRVSFAQDAEIKTDASLTVDKYLLNCTTTCAHLDAASQRAKVMGGKTTVFHALEAQELGNTQGAPTVVVVVDKNRLAAEEKLKELSALGDKLTRDLAPIAKQLKSKTAILKSSGGNVSDRVRAELKKWVDAYNTLNAKKKYVDEKSVELKGRLSAPQTMDGYVKVVGDIYPGVTINLYGMSRSIKNRMMKKVFRLRDDEIQSEG